MMRLVFPASYLFKNISWDINYINSNIDNVKIYAMIVQ
jgi:hypothetical protein